MSVTTPAGLWPARPSYRREFIVPRGARVPPVSKLREALGVRPPTTPRTKAVGSRHPLRPTSARPVLTAAPPAVPLRQPAAPASSSGTPRRPSSARTSRPIPLAEQQYVHAPTLDARYGSVEAESRNALDRFEYFRARRLTRSMLPVEPTDREEELFASIKEIQREKITRQNGQMLHMNLGAVGTTDHIYVRYPYPEQPFTSPLARWLLQINGLQRSPMIRALRDKYATTTIPGATGLHGDCFVDCGFTTLKTIWARHADISPDLGMSTNTTAFERFINEALFDVTDHSYDETVRRKLNTYVVDGREVYRGGDDAATAAAAPFVDAQRYLELFIALNNNSRHRMSFASGFLRLHILLLRAVPQVQHALVRLFLSMAYQKMALCKHSVSVLDFYNILTALQEFIESCSTVPASYAHPSNPLYPFYTTGSAEAVMSPSLYQKLQHRMKNVPAPPPAASPTRRIAVAAPEVAVLLQQLRDDVAAMARNVPNAAPVMRFVDIWRYFEPDALIVQYMKGGYDRNAHRELAAEGLKLAVTIPKFDDVRPAFARRSPDSSVSDRLAPEP